MITQVEERLADIAELCARHHVRRLELFGSATRDSFDAAKSDLDFLVEFGPVERGAYADAYFGLLFSLEDLFGRKVDLVERSAIRNPYFWKAIEPTRQVLYAA